MRTLVGYLTKDDNAIVADVTMVGNQHADCMAVLVVIVSQSITAVDGMLVASFAIINKALATELLATCTFLVDSRLV